MFNYFKPRSKFPSEYEKKERKKSDLKGLSNCFSYIAIIFKTFQLRHLFHRLFLHMRRCETTGRIPNPSLSSFRIIRSAALAASNSRLRFYSGPTHSVFFKPLELHHFSFLYTLELVLFLLSGYRVKRPRRTFPALCDDDVELSERVLFSVFVINIVCSTRFM